jgi:hypothetical protein
MADSVVFRQKLAEALSRGGLSDQAVAAEVLLLLPADFLDQYEALFLEAWKAPGMGEVGGVRRDPDAAVAPGKGVKWRVTSGQTETRGGATGKGGGGPASGLSPRNLRAQGTKEWVDRKLRKLARDIRTRMSDDEGPGVRRCTGPRCRKLAEDTWNWCPFCGAPTEDVEL